MKNKRVRKSIRFSEEAPELVHEFIEKIVVSAPTKINGKRYQQVDIYYNGVGVIKLPTAEESEYQFQNKYLKQKEKNSIVKLCCNSKSKVSNGAPSLSRVLLTIVFT